MGIALTFETNAELLQQAGSGVRLLKFFAQTSVTTCFGGATSQLFVLAVVLAGLL